MLTSTTDVKALDQADPLAWVRDRFTVPDGLIYLDGNSLGVLPNSVPERVERVVRQEWGQGLIRSWNTASWIDLPARVGARIAGLIGAKPFEVIAADSTSVNIFKVLLAALRLRPTRRVIVSDVDNFPTDLYIAQGVNDLLGGGFELRFVSKHDLQAAITDDVAVVMLTQVDYRTGFLYDMPGITQKAHAHGALTIWDLAHSAGAFPVFLNDCQADFAVGCGYKYLNGGPGAPAFLFVAERHLTSVAPLMAGWMGHEAPFEFRPLYQPAQDIRRLTVGTPGVLGMSVLEAALEVFDGVDMNLVRQKSLALGDLFIRLMEPICDQYGFELVTPKAHHLRGSQVSFRHEHGYAIVQALIVDGVIGDFRAPDIARFGLTPLYLRYRDVLEATERIERVMHEERWNTPQYRTRARVT
jgi:kynureninase